MINEQREVSGWTRRVVHGGLAACLGLSINLMAGNAQATTMELVSKSTTGELGNSRSTDQDISDDGRYVAFFSFADNLASATSGRNVYRHDRVTGETVLASRTTNGDPVVVSNWFAMSGDGQVVAFDSTDINVGGDSTFTGDDMYVYNFGTGITTRVSVTHDGSPANNGSADLGPPALSYDGRYVAFLSWATNLVPGGSNGYQQVYVRDIVGPCSPCNARVSVNSNGDEGNWDSGDWENMDISADGRYITFPSEADNLDLIVNDTNNRSDIFVHDRDPDNNGNYYDVVGTTERVSLNSAGAEGNSYGSYQPSISNDGQYVVFYSYASNFDLLQADNNNHPDTFVHDRATGTTERVSLNSYGEELVAGYGTYSVNISGNGRHVVFVSRAANATPEDTSNIVQLYAHDRFTGTTELISKSESGEVDNGGSGNWGPSGISEDGSVIAFVSRSTNLLQNDTDTNGTWDIFVSDRPTPAKLALTVQRLFDEGKITQQGSGLKINLITTLNQAQTNIDSGNIAGACTLLNSNTILLTNAPGNQIDSTAKDELITEHTNVMTEIGC